jgi:SNF family Na+-dependent transporter
MTTALDTERSGPTERWGTRLGLILAMAGNAVGLGNFIRFPAQAAQNDGGAFIIPYLISFVLMGIPLLWVEWAIGRHGGQYGHHSAPGMFDRLGTQPWLKYVGVFGLFTSLTIAGYYTYLESWTLAYMWHAAIGTFRTVDPEQFFADYLGVTAGSMFALPGQAFAFFIATLALNVYILSRGLVRGIELVAKIGLPLLLVFAVILAVRGLALRPGDPGVVASAMEGLNFVWHPNLSGVANPTTWLAAAGQIFFTLSVGMGSIHCYASYLRQKQDIALNASTAGWTNQLVEVVLGGTILIPIATAYLGLNAVQAATAGGSGFGLGFLTLPTLFNNWGWFAPIAGAMWFGLLFLAGITSSLAMGQPFLAFLEDEFGFKRPPAAAAFGITTFTLGFLCVWLYPGGSFDEFDFWTGTFSLVVFGFLEVVIFAWVFGMDRGWDEITRGADLKVPHVFRFVIRYVTPAFILVVFVGALIQPSGGQWGAAFWNLFGEGSWPFAPESIIGRVLHLGDASAWFDEDGKVTRIMVQDICRLVLLGVFVGLALLVRTAWNHKTRGNQ